MAVETKPTVLPIVALLSFWLYLYFTLVRDTGQWTYGVVFTLAIIGGAALVLRQHWSRPVLYLASALSVLVWLLDVVVATLNGVEYASPLAAFFSLLISAIPPMVAVGCSVFVFRHFRSSSSSV